VTTARPEGERRPGDLPGLATAAGLVPRIAGAAGGQGPVPYHAERRLIGHWGLVLLSSLVWLVLAAIILRFTAEPAAAAGLLFGAMFLLGVAWRTRQAARAAEAARPIAEADRMRTTLLAAVSHDLRSPFAAAKAAAGCLRAPGVQLTAGDRDELLGPSMSPSKGSSTLRTACWT
jgi:signal transduction histidine kinase